MKKLNVLIKNIILLSSVATISLWATAYNALTNAEKQEVKNDTVATNPLSIASLNVPSMVMLVIGRDHNLFTEAYNDYTDLNPDDNVSLNIMFDPAFEYYGIFDSALCYEYKEDFTKITNIVTNDKQLGYWLPVGTANYLAVSKPLEMWNDKDDKKKVYTCPADAQWSGNFLNYVTSSRIDVIKKVLYGGTRVTSTTQNDYSTNTQTAIYTDGNKTAVLLKHSNVLRDAHAWGKVWAPQMYKDIDGANAFTYSDFIGISTIAQPAGVNADAAIFFGMGSYDDNSGIYNKQRAAYLRYGWVNNAGVPGVSSAGETNLNFIWDWASLESESEKNSLAILDKNNGMFVGSPITDGLDVIVVACLEPYTNDASCKNYGSDTSPIWRPAGILQQYGEGENPRIKFGLITGSWVNNLNSGALRANIGDFSNEVASNGNFNYHAINCAQRSICGVISVLDGFRISEKIDGVNQYSDCQRSSAKSIINSMGNGTCKDWGNPVSKLLSNSAMYFKGSKLTSFKDQLNLGSVDQKNPYENGNEYCAKPVSLVIADESITFDGNSGNTSQNYASDYDGVEVGTILQTLDTSVNGKSFLMGMSRSDTVHSLYNYFPSVKTISSLADVVGLAPSVPFAFGSYNVAAIAKYYSKNKDIVGSSKDTGKSQKHAMETFVVAMKPNMPEIKIAIPGTQDSYVTIVPFAKSTEYENNSGLVATNQIVDFYSESFTEDSGVFRINFEDYQYGSDYDMDWIVEYSYKLIQGKSGNYYVRVQLRDVKGDGYADQHAGYVITGVKNTGVYVDLEKPSAGGRGNTAESTKAKNMYDMDNIISDMTFINCEKTNNFNITELDLSTKVGMKKCLREAGFATTVPSWSGKVSKETEICFRPKNVKMDDSDATAIALYNEFYTTENIDNYYNTRILPAQEFYYSNRSELKTSLDYNTYEDGPSNRFNFVLGNIHRCTKGDFVSASSRTFLVDPTQGDNVWLKSPLWYAAKNGLTSAPTASTADPSNYYLVTNPSQLKDGISRMMNEIDKAVHSGSTMPFAEVSTTSETAMYATQYDPSAWWGTIVKTKVSGTTGGYSDFSSSVSWRADEAFEKDAKQNLENRVVVTYDVTDNKLVRLYAKDQGDSDDKPSAYSYLGKNVFNKIVGNSLTATDDNINDLTDSNLFVNRFIRWLLGDETHEAYDDGKHENEILMLNDKKPLRVREEGNEHFVLGDIIDSDVVAFKNASGDSYLVVGANDGMLHFIDDKTGKPVFSYIPSEFLSSIKNQAKQDYVATSHKFMLNSTPVVYKKTVDNEEKIYVYGVYGMGFAGGYALDVTDIGKFNSITAGQDRFNQISASNTLLWELSPKSTVAFKDGKYRGSDLVGKMNYSPTKVTVSNVDYLVYSSGFEANTPGVFIVDLLGKNGTCSDYNSFHTACFINEIPLLVNNAEPVDPVGLGRKDAVGPVSVVRISASSQEYDAIYFGDYFGYLWKIDLTGGTDLRNNIKCWGKKNGGECNLNSVSFKAEPNVVFKAVDTENVAQPITSKIGAAYLNNGLSLVFGTGSYVTDIDNKTVSKNYNTYQSFYSLRDMDYNNSISEAETKRCATSGDHCVVKANYQSGTANRTYVLASSATYGWYVDLGPIEGGTEVANSGERIYTDPLILADYVYITTNTPNTSDPCAGSGTSSLVKTNILAANFNYVENFTSLAKSPVVTVLDGKVIVHVSLDPVSAENPSGGDNEMYDLPQELKQVKESSKLRIY